MPSEALSEAFIPVAESLEGYTSAVNIYEGVETVVYRAVSAVTRVSVILKATKNAFPTARELARLRREFTILRELDLPFTPKAHALQEHGRGLVLIMADIGYPTLREILDRSTLDIEAALTIAISLCDVLSEVHLRRIIHKDIAPRNIIIDEAKRAAYLLDFGIAARLSQEMHAPASLNALEGTLLYIAPEQTGKMNRAVDLRADLYSLGAVLYEMLTGSVPFSAEDPMKLIHCHLARRATPPHEREPSVPRPLSDIVMGLLAKTPEERYQSDAGLKADLVECLRQWKTGRSIEPFPLRRHDKATELRRPQKLYGREQDIEVLLQAFERTRLRGPELVLVSGYSGIGKSALVNEMHKLAAGEGGHFVSGKFDQISQEMPLAPVVHAFRDLILQILTKSAESLAKWKGDLLGALAGNGHLITDLIPELELIIGPQPELSDVSPAQAKNRFEITLQNFLDVFADAEHPLVIFLDDLQWIDPASANLMKLLLVDAYTEHMLIIGAYRDNEVGPGHPLSLMLDELQKKSFRVTDIHLRPLDPPTVREFVADMLTSTEDDVADLAALIHEKTQGSPFFVYQFMVTLKEEGLLSFDAVAGEWQWKVERIRTANVTDNVVDLMLNKLRRLAPETRKALSFAACMGHSFDLRTLSTISEKEIAETAAALWEAMREGYVIPLDEDYRLLEGLTTAIELPADFNIHYRFLHDRILHAAYMLVEDERRRSLHLSIGRLLRNRAGADASDEDLLEVVRHKNLGAEAIDDPRERLDLARLNLRAGRKARAATAWSAASDYFRAGIGLLCESDWESDYDLCYALHVDGAECAYLAGDEDGANALFNTVIPRTKTALERASICLRRTYMLFWSTKYTEALEMGGEGFTHLGYPWNPADLTSQEVFGAELGQVYANLGGRRALDLINEPEVSDPRIRMIMELFDAMESVAYQLGQAQFGVVVLKSVNVALKHGITDACAYSFGLLGLILGAVLGKVDEGLPFSMLALEINKKYPNAMHTPRVHISVGTSNAYLVGTLRDVERHCKIARDTALSVGELGMSAIGSFLSTAARLQIGDQLDDVIEEADKHLVITRRGKEQQWIAAMVIERQVVLNLLGRTRSRSTLSDDEFNEEEYIGNLAEPLNGIATFMYWTLRAHVHYLYGEYAEAAAAAVKADERMMFGGGNPLSKVLPFYLCMAMLSAPPAPEEEAKRREELFRKYRAELDALAARSPAGWSYQKVLVDAEAARAAGKVEQAIALYEQAIHLSQEHKVPHMEAMACELASRLYMRIGAQKASAAYLRDAYRAYLHWGAVVKADALAAEVGEIMPALRTDVARTRTRSVRDTAITHSAILSRTTLGNLRDAGLVLRASQAIATEIDLGKVIARLVGLVLENAGAQRGALILSRQGEFVVSATFGDGPTAIDEKQGKPLEDTVDVAKSVVLYVARTQEPVVLDEPGAVTRFSEDPYLRSAAPKSVLGLPLLYQARLVGVLYLENRATAGVFNAARVELLALLSSQAAIAIENASLYADLLSENAERRRAEQEVRTLNSELEQRVEERTRQLKEANQELEAFSYSVSHDLRSPLRTIDGFSLALLEDHGEKLESDARDALARVRKASLRMHELIDDLLALSRVARSEMARVPVDLSALSREVAAEIQRASPGREVTWVIADGLTATGDPKMLKIALENLLGNAFKFTGKRAHAKIEFGARVEPDGKRAFFVRDDGAGFDMTYMSKLFGAFQRLHKVDEFEGTGIGLATVRRIIGRHGGQIWAQSAVDKGATFSFTL